MERKSFESHLFGSKQLPFIFHLDIHKEDLKDGLDMNWHPSIELLYFTEGSGKVFCGTQIFNVAVGDLFIVNSNMPHAIASETVVYYHCLIVDNEFCMANDIDTDNIIFKTPLKEAQAAGMFETVVHEFHAFQPYKNAGIKAAVLNLLVYLARNCAETIAVPQSAVSMKDESMKLAIGYIKSHINEKLSLDEVANEAGLSKYYFLREFKKMTGETPVSFINKTRCENAKKMLKTGRYSIKEVCEKNGFEDLSYFSKNFKRYTGQTPSKYLKKNTAD